MADEQIVTNIVAKSDFSSLIADLHRVTASLSQLQETSASTNRALASQIDAINRTFESNLRKTGQFSTHFVSLTSDVDKFGRNLDSGRLKLRDYFNAYQQHTRTSGGLIRDLAKQQVQLQNAILQPLGRNAQGLMQFNVHVPRGLDLVRNKTALAKQELQIMNKVIQDGGIQLINWGKNTQWAGRQLTVGLTLPIAAFGKAAADAFKQADQELTRLTKVYGDIAGTSAEELGKVRNEVAQTAKDLSAAMGVSFTETIALAADIAATGKTGNDLLSSVSETTRLAVLGEVDRQEAMKATLAIQTAFKQNNEELAASINFLNAVENQTSTTLNDLVEAIPKAGPVIKGLGGSVQDLALYLTAMREGGINASEGANALKSALASLINPTDVAVAKFKSFGIDLMGIVNNNAGNVTNTLLALQSSLDKLNPLQKQQAIEQLFGKFQYSRLNALFENLGKQGSQTLQVLDLMSASAAELEAVAGRELAAVTESASGKYRRAIESLRANLSGIGEDFLNIGTKVINVFNKILEVIDKLPDPIKKFVTLGGVFTAIAGPVIMLTGVMGNFIGYMVKGYGHIKAFLKGGEGFKLLTPEILATQQAAGLVENAFYSDAKAAAILGQSIQALTADYVALNAAMTQGVISTNPTIMTAGGTVVSGSRTVNPAHPLVGGLASAHLNPRDPKNPATIFGLIPQSNLVNQKIGRTPQIIMEERLPNIEGLTSVRKTLKTGEVMDISTGVVAEEASRYQALIGTLGMQSKREIQSLKDVIDKGGQVSTEFMATFDDILPITQRLTTNAAKESAAIVAQLQSGKITAEAAKAEIIRVNAQLESMLGAEITAYATSKGRTIDLTKVPLIDQPVVDPATGKSNVRALTRRGRMRELMYSLGRATRTRMFGAPYSIETTKPPGFNMGGKVFYNNGDQVPGPNINADVVPAMLTPGEFVIRRDIAQQDPEGMRALNEGRATIMPVQNRFAGGPIQRILSSLTKWNPNMARGARRFYDAPANGSRASNSPRVFDPGVSYGPESYHTLFRRASGTWNVHGGLLRYGERKENEILGHVITSKFLRQFKGFRQQGSSRVLPGSEFERRFGVMPGGATANKQYQVLPDNLITITKDFNRDLANGTATGLSWLSTNRQPQHFISLISHLLNAGVPYKVAYRVAGRTLSRINNAMRSIGNRPLTETKWGNIVDDAMSREIKALESSYKTASKYKFNRGGMVPGYAMGGSIARSSYLYRRAMSEGSLRDNVLPKSYLLKALGAKFSTREGGKGYSVTSLPINPNLRMFEGMGLSPAGQKALYGGLVDTIVRMKPQTLDKNIKKGFGKHDVDSLWYSAVGEAQRNSKLNPSDKAIIDGFYDKASRLQMPMPQSVVKQLFGKRQLNKGGMIRGYNRGGMIPGSNIPRYNRGGAVLKLLAMLGLPLAGQAVGESVGGKAGSAISTASWIAPMFMGTGMLSGMFGRTAPNVGQRLGISREPIGYMRQSVFARDGMLGKFSETVGTAATSGGRFASVLGKIAVGATRLNIAVAAVTTAVYLGVKAWKNYQETQNRIANSFGMTAEQAKKAGLQYTDFNKKIKDAIANQKAIAERNRLVYESLTLSNTPLNLTIEQYKKLKAQVQKTMPDIIDNINKMNNMEASDYAVQLKTQFIAYGDTVDEATKKVYALFAASDKKFMAGAAIAQKSFGSIKTASDAAAKAIDLYGVSLEKANATGQANAVNTSLMAIDSAIQNTIKNSKSQLSYYDAMKKTLDEINSKVTNQKTLTEETITAIGEQNPELANVLNKTDTIVSAWAKYQIILKGVNLQLNSLNANQAIAVNNAIQLISQTVSEKLISGSGVLADENAQLKKLTAQYNTLQKQAAGLSAQKQIDSRKRIEQLQEELNLIKEQADERRKALQEEKENQDINLQIQKKQIEYQSLLSQGRNAEAAQARIDVQGLIGERERLFATRSIDEAEKAAAAPIEAEIKRLQKANQDAADAAALAADKLNVLGKAIDKLKTTIAEVTQAMLTTILGALLDKNYFNTDAGKAALANLQKILGDTGNVPADFKPPTPPTIDTSKGAPGPGQVAGYQNEVAKNAEAARKQLYDAVAGSIQKGLEGKDIVMSAQEVIIQTGAVSGPGTAKSPINLGSKATTTSVNPINLSSWNGTWGSNSTRELVKYYAKNQGVQPGQYFTMTDPKGKVYKFKLDDNGNVTMITDPYKKMASGGYVSGSGTSTSDSIPARLSNGEYVFSAKAVLNAGGPVVMDSMHNSLKSSRNFAMGGYVNPSFSANMKLPSFETGVNTLYSDTIAQLHKNEAVVPAEFNPWNPTASNPLGGTYTINNQISVEAAPGMNTEELAAAVARKIEIKNRETMAKIGISRSR